MLLIKMDKNNVHKMTLEGTITDLKFVVVREEESFPTLITVKPKDYAQLDATKNKIQTAMFTMADFLCFYPVSGEIDNEKLTKLANLADKHARSIVTGFYKTEGRLLLATSFEKYE